MTAWAVRLVRTDPVIDQARMIAPPVQAPKIAPVEIRSLIDPVQTIELRDLAPTGRSIDLDWIGLDWIDLALTAPALIDLALIDPG